MPAIPSHTTVRTGPYTAVRRVKLRTGGQAGQAERSLDHLLPQPFGSRRAFGPALRRERFGPCLDNPRSFTPLRCREGQLPLVFSAALRS